MARISPWELILVAALSLLFVYTSLGMFAVLVAILIVLIRLYGNG